MEWQEESRVFGFAEELGQHFDAIAASAMASADD
ncbi:hypothetical protein R69927_05661 [Paraburkholderia domus]|jgi:hypothetical protein|nr:hypothetical protein R70006_03737 [Paraburkholderia domus]CAE6905712.1 hypothetical protein R69927_05661 [Paraburkholderia domus]